MSLTSADVESDALLLARYVEGRDQAAFREIVRRHGPMVLSVAYRILCSREDAEDALQATFLALAGGGRKLRDPAALAGWLHQTAVRTSRSILRSNAKWERNCETKAKEQERMDVPDRRQEIVAAIDEELARLPVSCRAAVVLCDLEGLTRKEAARQLEAPVATVTGQVRRGRQLLRRRLVRRGVGLSAAALSLKMQSLAQAAAPVSPELVQHTTDKAALIAAGKSAAEIGVSPAVVHATSGVLKTMTLAKIAVACSLLAAVPLVTNPVSSFFEAPAYASTIVVPTGYEDAPGDAFDLSGPPPPHGLRSQHLVPATDFADLPSGDNEIVSFAFRPDETIVSPQAFSFDLQFRLSTTSAEPGAMSSTFADNLGDDATIVYSGPITWSTPGQLNADGVNGFDYLITFTTPFSYDPALGNLLVEYTINGPYSGPSPKVDTATTGQTHIVAAGGSSSVFGNLNSTERFVGRFEFVPEPAAGTTAALSLIPLGVIGLAATARRRSSNPSWVHRISCDWSTCSTSAPRREASESKAVGKGATSTRATSSTWTTSRS